MHKSKRSILIPSGKGFLFDRNYDYTSYLLIKLFAWGSKIDSNFGFPIVNFEDHRFGSIPILRNMNIKFIVYYRDNVTVSFPSTGEEAKVELEPNDVRFIESYGAEDVSGMYKIVMDFKHQIEYFQAMNKWDILIRHYNPATDDLDESHDFRHVFPYGRLIINDDIYIDVDMNPFRYDWDSDHEDGLKRFRWFMDRVGCARDGVNGIMPSSLCMMYAEMRWSSGKFRLPYIAPCRDFRTLNFNSTIESKTYVMVYMRPEMDIYQNDKLIAPSNIQIDRLDPRYSDVYALPFEHFRRLFNGKLKYKCIDRTTNHIYHFMEAIYPVMVFKFHARASAQGLLRNMFVLMGC